VTDLYALLKIVHIVGATVLLGTGAGIAFFMLMAHRTRDPALIATDLREGLVTAAGVAASYPAVLPRVVSDV
jgi:uncharacterized membrane protein